MDKKSRKKQLIELAKAHGVEVEISHSQTRASTLYRFSVEGASHLAEGITQADAVMQGIILGDMAARQKAERNAPAP